MVTHSEAQKLKIMFFENFKTSFKDTKMHVNRFIVYFEQNKSKSKK